MALTLTITETKENVQQWVDHESGAKFLVNGISNKAYNVAMDQIGTKARTIDIKNIQEFDESPNEMALEAAGRYLIADWQGVQIGTKGKEQLVPYSKDMAALALKNSVVLWHFIIDNSVRIQNEADHKKDEIMGKLETESTGKARTQRKSKTQSTNT